jgi:hypothetical protein
MIRVHEISHEQSILQNAACVNVFSAFRSKLSNDLPRGRAGGMPPCADVETVLLQMRTVTGAPNSKKLRGAQPSAVAHLQNFLDVSLAYLVARERLPVIVAGQSRKSADAIFPEDC